MSSHVPLVPSTATLLRVLQQRALYQSDEVGYRFLMEDGEPEQSRALTYGELGRRVYAIAGALQAAEAVGTPVLLTYPPGLDFVVAFWGCLAAGAIAVPVPAPSSPHSLHRMLSVVENAGARVALGTTLTKSMYERRVTRYEALPPLQWLLTETLTAEHQDGYRVPAITDDALAYLQYTSGSTGMPKGVKISHANMVHNATGVTDKWQVRADTIQVQWMPTFHDLGLITGVVVPLLTGTPVLLLSPLSVTLHPIRWLRAIARMRATFSGGPNFALEQCIRDTTPTEREGLDLSTWRVAYTGGEVVHAATLERFAATFAPYGFRAEAFRAGYGLAEATLLVTSTVADTTTPRLLSLNQTALEHHHVLPETGADAITLVACGAPVAGLEVVIVDPDTQSRVRTDAIGEIWVAGPSVARGYWNAAAEDAATFGAVLATEAKPFLRTGDLGFFRDGALFVTGRLKDLMIIRGRNLYPHDIETTVGQCHPALVTGATAVFPITMETEERLVVVQEVARDQFAFEEMTLAIRQAISGTHEVKPYAVVLIRYGTISKTSSGKIARRPTRTAFVRGTLDVVHQWNDTPSSPMDVTSVSEGPRTVREIEAWLVTYLAQALGTSPDTIATDQPVTGFGLDSADILRTVRALELWLGSSLSPTIFWNYPTIRALASHVGDPLGRTDATRSVSVPDVHEPIAVIGMGCRFPGAPSPDAFWAQLRDGLNAVTEIPPERWPAAAFYDATAAVPGKMSTRHGAFLNQVDHFDAAFFGISPREAIAMDPQQRLVLEVAWEALEYAGIAPAPLAGSQTGVFLGISVSEYAHLQVQNTPLVLRDRYAGTGSALTFAANRLSYLLDLHGPSMAIDTACSSSLVALHLGCQSLHTGESDMVMAGGVNLILTPDSSVVFSQLNVLASDGKSKPFEESADGYGRGEGCGIVILKRLSDARADGNTVLALIHGTAVNQDGRSNGLTAPNGRAQQAVIRTALERASMSPADVSYIEAHGTGTALGDPIEVEALAAVLATAPSTEPCWLGAVKANIGHLEPAAGVAGLIKVILALQHEEIPPQPQFRQLNPHITLAGTRLAIPLERTPWRRTTRPRVAGISAFALGGTNAHLIVGEASPPAPSDTEAAWQVLVLSAKSPAALDQQAQRLATFLQGHPALSLTEVAYTLQTGRAAFRYRRTIVCRAIDQALSVLTEAPPTPPTEGVTGTVPGGRETVFMFPGQGTQYSAMAEGLYRSEAVFRDTLDTCATLLMPHLHLDLRDILYPRAAAGAAAAGLLAQTWLTQPALFAIGYALAVWWRTLGIEPTAMIGHSIGEYVAACVAEVMTLPDALALVTARGRLMQAVPPGDMLAVPLPDTELLPFLSEAVSLAAVNGPQRCVVSGPGAAIEALRLTLAQQGIACQLLETSHAFHSAMMTPMMAAFADEVARYPLHPPRIPYLSNLTGDWITAADATTPAYYANHLRHAVRFDAGLRQLLALPNVLLLEVGPGQTLSRLVQRHPDRRRDHTVLASVRDRHGAQPDLAFLLQSLGQVWETGCDVLWERRATELSRRVVALPTYPFERQRYWIDVPQRPVVPAPDSATQAVAAPSVAAPPDRFYLGRPIWDPLPLSEPPRPAAAAVWLVFGDDTPFAGQLTKYLRDTQTVVVTVRVGVHFARQTHQNYTLSPTSTDHFDALLESMRTDVGLPTQVLYLWGMGVATALLAEGAPRGDALARLFYAPLFFVQALGRQVRTDPLRLTMLTRDLQPGGGDGPIVAAQALLLGLCKVLPHEYPDITCRCMDVPHPAGEGVALDEVLANLLPDLIGERSDAFVAYRAHTRWVPTVVAMAPAAETLPPLRTHGVYLITGGTGGVGLALAEVLAQADSVRLVLVSRTEFPAPSDWERWLATHAAHERISRVLRAVQALQARGAEVWLARADITDAHQMRQLVTDVETVWGPVHGVIHAAGVAKAGMVQTKIPTHVNAVLAPKVWGTVVLARAFASTPLDFVVLCSSLSAVVGGVGLVDYCAANAFLDAYAHEWRTTQDTLVVSLNWDLWQGVGMAASAGVPATASVQGHPLLGDLVVQPGTGHTFTTTLTPPYPWVLAEHRVFAGDPTLPGTAYLDLMYAAVAAQCEEGTIQLRDVAFVAPLVIPNGETRDLLTQVERRGTAYGITVMSRRLEPGASWETHALADAVVTPQRPSPSVDLVALQARCQRASGSEATLPALEGYGPRWQTVIGVTTSTHESLMELSLPAPFTSDLDRFELHPALLEGVTALIRQTVPEAYLPFRYQQVTVYHPLVPHCYSHVRRLPPADTPDLLRFDITVLDPEGTVLVEIEGFTMKRATPSSDLHPSLCLVATTPGLLSSLTLRPHPRRVPEPGEVEIEVYSAGLNVKDVLSAHGLINAPLGIECAGRVSAVGAGVTPLQVGMEVIALAPTCFSTFAITDATLVVPKPPRLSFDAAATLPIVFMTAAYALDRLAQLQSGERVLIHAASGGVGLAAIQIAKRVDAEIFATADSPAQQDFLRSLGIQHVMDSRTAAFGDDIMERTHGTGVDVVLNSLSDALLERSLTVLAPYGRFVELGTQNVLQARALVHRPVDHNLSFFALDLERMVRERPTVMGPLLREIVQQVEQGDLAPIPFHAFALADACAAFEQMTRAPHSGKVVLVAARPPAPPAVVGVVQGVQGLTRSAAQAAFRDILTLAAKEPQIVVASVPPAALPLQQMPVLAAVPATNRRYPRPPLTSTFMAGHTPIEQRIARIWEQVLSIEPIGIHDNFFELGGDSLSGAQALAALKRDFQVELAAASLYQAPTISALVRLVSGSPHPDSAFEEPRTRGAKRRATVHPRQRSDQ